MSETIADTIVCSSCKLVYPTRASFRGKCSFQDCNQLICEDCWAHGIRECGTHQKQFVEPFPKLKTSTEATPSIAELAKQGVEEMAAEQALGVALVHAVGQSATRGIQLLRPEIRSSADGSSLWLKKKRFFRSPLIIEAEYASADKGVSGLRDQALKSVEDAKTQKNTVLKCFTCAKPSIDMIAFAERFSDPKLTLYLIDNSGKAYYNLEDHRAQHYLKLIAPSA